MIHSMHWKMTGAVGYVYAMSSLVFIFGATSLFFGIMAAIGYFAHVDLSSLRNFLVGGLVFLLVFWVVSMFINLQRFEMMACGREDLYFL